tara:strand:- start:24030 stop:24476 length:447 start_codon:yes stop_codon:yes gene_type:complete
MNNFKITNLAERNECLMWISDLYKDVHGFRPRSYNFESFSFQELTDYVNDLNNMAEEQAKQEKEWAEKCVVKFKKNLKEVINNGAGDEETALRWMLQGDMGDSKELDMYAIESFTMQRGIDYTPYGDALENKLIKIVNNNPSAFGIAA